MPIPEPGKSTDFTEAQLKLALAAQYVRQAEDLLKKSAAIVDDIRSNYKIDLTQAAALKRSRRYVLMGDQQRNWAVGGMESAFDGFGRENRTRAGIKRPEDIASAIAELTARKEAGE